jgi:nucleoside-diphosphate-sugar epimerase
LEGTKLSKFAIIGAGGFVGSRLVQSLVLDERAIVRAVGRSFASFASLACLGSAIERALANAQDRGALAAAFKGCDVAINLVSGEVAAIINSTSAIYAACLDAGVKRLIHMSSAVVYGRVEDPITEDDAPPAPNLWSPYAKAKRYAETFLRTAPKSDELEIIVLRPGIVWGPHSPWSFKAAKDLLAGKAYLVGEGEGICNLIHIDNLVFCITTCALHPRKAAGFYNIADSSAIIWREFYASAAGCLGLDLSKMPRVPADRFRPSFQYRLNAIRETGWSEKLKSQVPEAYRVRIKRYLRQRAVRHAKRQGDKPAIVVDRQMWELQTTRHKLPTEKFTKVFGCTMPVSFNHGYEMTVEWLKAIGLGKAPHAPRHV